MNAKHPPNIERRRFLKTALWLPVSLAAWVSSGCALPMLMKAKTKKISQDHFSCGENCPHAVKEAGQQRDSH